MSDVAPYITTAVRAVTSLSCDRNEEKHRFDMKEDDKKSVIKTKWSMTQMGSRQEDLKVQYHPLLTLTV